MKNFFESKEKNPPPTKDTQPTKTNATNKDNEPQFAFKDDGIEKNLVNFCQVDKLSLAQKLLFSSLQNF